MEIGVLRRDGRTDAFFDGAAADRLVIRRCEACASWYPPDASECLDCGGEELGWAEASGHATLVSWAVSHGRPRPDGPVPKRAAPTPATPTPAAPTPAAPTPAAPTPATSTPAAPSPGAVSPTAVLALVELSEGPWLHSRLDAVAPAGLREGLPLRAHFEHPGQGESYLTFRPAQP
jgi:uncharacterized OB-fold protein